MPLCDMFIMLNTCHCTWRKGFKSISSCTKEDDYFVAQHFCEISFHEFCKKS